MPDPTLDARQESMKFVDTPSVEGYPICFGPDGTRLLRGGGAPSRSVSDSDDRGKGVVVEGDTDVSGVTGKELMNIASSSFSSSSSSTVAETQDMFNNLASGSGSQHDEAENTTDVPEAPPMSLRSLAITPMSESDPHLYRRNFEPRLFEDTPEQANTSSGLGNYESMRLMELPEEPRHDADPQQLQEREGILMLSTTIVTLQVPGFSMDLAGGIVPFAEEQSVEDPNEVGLENLNIFMNP